MKNINLNEKKDHKKINNEMEETDREEEGKGVRGGGGGGGGGGGVLGRDTGSRPLTLKKRLRSRLPPIFRGGCARTLHPVPLTQGLHSTLPRPHPHPPYTALPS